MSFENPGPVETSLRDAISPIEEIIEEARKGRMYILVDHEDRENEGDLVIAAEFADAAAINFMAQHGRGLICLPMTAERIDRLGLPMMAVNNSSRHETAFTVSIEAREGVSTGISAHDRALTVATAINEQNTMVHLATPGHVFPLRAKPAAESEAISRLDIGDIAPVVTDLTANIPSGWNAIALPDGGIGFTDALGLDELTPGAICFGKDKGRWKIVATIQRGG